jgi:hypothetical protein
MTSFKSRLPVPALIAVNLLPLIGVIWLGWDASVIVLLYWTENLIIGGFNVLRILLVPVEHPALHLQKLFAIPFFCVHFGGFCAVHGLFLIAFFRIGGGMEASFKVPEWPGPLVFLGLLFSVAATLWENLPEGMELLLICLTLSHGISFVHNVVIGKEYASMTVSQLMTRPYRRIVLLHVAIIGGGIPIMMLGSPAPLLLLLVFLKIVMDVWLHVRSHGTRRIVRKESVPLAAGIGMALLITPHVGHCESGEAIGWRGRPAPECRGFVVTEFGIGARLNDSSHRARAESVPAEYAVYDLGAMFNVDRNTALGATVSVKLTNETYLGVLGRYRRWLDDNWALDVSAGPFLAGDSNDGKYELQYPSAAGRVGLRFGDWWGITGGVEMARVKGRDAEADWFADVRLGNFPGFAAGVLFLVLAAAYSTGVAPP